MKAPLGYVDSPPMPPATKSSTKPAVAAPERSLVQRMDALQRANEIRTRRAQLKRDLKGGRVSIHDLLLEPASAHVEHHLRLVDQEVPLDDVARLDPVEGEDLVAFDETRSGCG